MISFRGFIHRTDGVMISCSRGYDIPKALSCRGYDIYSASSYLTHGSSYRNLRNQVPDLKGDESLHSKYQVAVLKWYHIALRAE